MNNFMNERLKKEKENGGGRERERERLQGMRPWEFTKRGKEMRFLTSEFQNRTFKVSILNLMNGRFSAPVHGVSSPVISLGLWWPTTGAAITAGRVLPPEDSNQPLKRPITLAMGTATIRQLPKTEILGLGLDN